MLLHLIPMQTVVYNIVNALELELHAATTSRSCLSARHPLHGDCAVDPGSVSGGKGSKVAHLEAEVARLWEYGAKHDQRMAKQKFCIGQICGVDEYFGPQWSEFWRQCDAKILSPSDFMEHFQVKPVLSTQVAVTA